ncbi:hypothetical protein B0H67DRAFT_551897 [Lasiosphaeris hirsuta]|uniref:Uncharacterized protein n=1 Tax=Lasiosphaeris hirsuta TaxID=260670 RepID=A0AA40E1V2_9PEZI|nr:hypothetical protein B0H67DRAFT_551897 [Lasiosphaeris hirsuta]
MESKDWFSLEHHKELSQWDLVPVEMWDSPRYHEIYGFSNRRCITARMGKNVFVYYTSSEENDIVELREIQGERARYRDERMKWMEEKHEFERRQLENAKVIKALEQQLDETWYDLDTYKDHLLAADDDLGRTTEALRRVESNLAEVQTEQARAASQKARETEVTIARFRDRIKRMAEENNKLRRQLEPVSQPSLSLTSTMTVVSVEPSDDTVAETPPCAAHCLQLRPQHELELEGFHKFQLSPLIGPGSEDSEFEFHMAKRAVRSEFKSYWPTSDSEDPEPKDEMFCPDEQFKQHGGDSESGLKNKEFKPENEELEEQDEGFEAEDEYCEAEDGGFESLDEDFARKSEDSFLSAWDVLSPTRCSLDLNVDIMM